LRFPNVIIFGVSEPSLGNGRVEAMTLDGGFLGDGTHPRNDLQDRACDVVNLWRSRLQDTGTADLAERGYALDQFPDSDLLGFVEPPVYCWLRAQLARAE